MAGRDLTITCRCGTLKGVLQAVGPKDGAITCYCRDCQTAAHALGVSDILDDYGGTEVYQTLQARITFTAGQENLACLRLSPKGLLRWYAACCNTPIANTMPSKAMTFVGLPVVALPDYREALRFPRGTINVKWAQNPPATLKDKGMARVIWGALSRQLVAMVKGDRATPFFDAEGDPVVEPRVLSLEERRAATPA